MVLFLVGEKVIILGCEAAETPTRMMVTSKNVTILVSGILTLKKFGLKVHVYFCFIYLETLKCFF